MVRTQLTPLVRCLKESEEAILFKRLAYLNPIARKYLIAIPNGGYRNPREGKNLKAQGVRAGVSDYFLAYPHKSKPGLWIELKRRNSVISKPTAEQSNWLADMKSLGYEAELAYGADQAIAILNQYLGA